MRRFDGVLIAGVAQAADMTIATRNIRHFEPLGGPCFKPWARTHSTRTDRLRGCVFVLVFCAVFCIVFGMAIFADVYPELTLSVTAATGRGVAGLVKDAERGEDIIVERHGRAVAAIISVEHFDELHRVRVDLAAAALVLAREFTDTGNRVALNDVITAFGFDRAELEAELDADIAAGHE